MRFGIIGTGPIVERFLQAAQPCATFALDTVYSRSPGRAAEFAARYGAPHSCCDLSGLFASPHIDAVYIASPNALHHCHAIAAMRGGKHVLCEKPAASNTAELADMLHVARECGVLFLEASRHIHAPYVQTLRDALPALSPIRRVSLVYNQYSSRYEKFKNGIVENAFDPSLSNGALMDIGVYCVQLMVRLFGEPRGINAHAVKLKNGLDGHGFILADYGQMLAELSYSKISDARTPSTIQGEDGALLFDPMAAPGYIRLNPRKGESRELSFPRYDNDMRFEVESFLAMAGEPAHAGEYHDCSLISMRIMDEARRQQGIVFPADSR